MERFLQHLVDFFIPLPKDYNERHFSYWNNVALWAQSPSRPILPRQRQLTASQCAIPQLQSPLFSLPKEVRELIFTFAIGGRLVHIEDVQPHRCRQGRPKDASFPKHLVHLHCEEPFDSRKWHQPHSCIKSMNSSRPKGPKYWLLALPLTCKTTYTEVINHFYREPVFSFREHWVVGSLPRLILPQRLLQIRTLFLDAWIYMRDINFRDDARQSYQQAWSVLKSLTGLLDLRVCIGSGDSIESYWRANEAIICDPIRDFPHLLLFEVIVPAYPEWISDQVDWKNCCVHEQGSMVSIHKGGNPCVLDDSQ